MGLCLAVAPRRPGVELSHDFEYFDYFAPQIGPPNGAFSTRRRLKATLNQVALHDVQVQTLRRYKTTDMITESPSSSSFTRFPASVTCTNLCSVTPGVPRPVVDRAVQIVEQGRYMADVVSQEGRDLLHRDWPGPSGMDPLDELLEEGDANIKTHTILVLARACSKFVGMDSTVVDVGVPTRVFGDLHGQFRDLLLLLHDFGCAADEGPVYVFNGDFVDRGRHQLEVIVLLFALKIAYPRKVVLLRGNHEDVEMNKHMGPCGFCHHCFRRLGQDLGWQVIKGVSDVFDMLPLAALVDDQILVLHGGIGAGNWDMGALRSVARPLCHDDLAGSHVLWNILWSDPIPDEAEDHFGVHDSPRDNHQNIMKTFGKDVTARFCERHSLEMVVRSHQALRGGCGYEVMHSGRCVRVFSARDYEGSENDGSTLLITRAQSTGKLVVLPQVLRSVVKASKGPPSAAKMIGNMLPGGGRLW